MSDLFFEKFRSTINENECEYINQLNQIEKNSILIKEKDEFFLNLVEKLKKAPFLEKRDYSLLKEASKTYGGFLRIQYRLIFYTAIIEYKKFKKSFQNLKLNDEVILNKATLNHKETNFNRNDETINKDCERSVINIFSIFLNADKQSILKESNNDSNNNHKDLTLKEDLMKRFSNYLKRLFQQNKDIDYYQGYNDICVYFYILQLTNGQFNPSFDLINEFNEHFLSPYLIQDSQEGCIKFDIALLLLSELINLIDSNVSDILLNLDCNTPVYALSWIITLFSHKNENIFLQYRIIDYIMCAHSYAAYYLSATVFK